MLANCREINAAAIPHWKGVIRRSSGSGRFMRILARENYNGVNTETIVAKGLAEYGRGTKRGCSVNKESLNV